MFVIEIAFAISAWVCVVLVQVVMHYWFTPKKPENINNPRVEKILAERAAPPPPPPTTTTSETEETDRSEVGSPSLPEEKSKSGLPGRAHLSFSIEVPYLR